MSIFENYEAILDARGTRGVGATADELETVTRAHPAFPIQIRQLLTIQNGEDPMRALGLGIRFIGAEEMVGSLATLREMIEDDDTLPNCFLEFIPFLSTDLKSDVGVFTERSAVMPGQVVELHYETGEIISWATCLDDFLSTLQQTAALNSGLGSQFPADGQAVVSIHDLPGWEMN